MARKPTKPSRIGYQHIWRALRQRMVSERWPAGTKLVSQGELKREFGVSSQTIQRAIDRLAAEGFIRTESTSGTFVVDRPPYLCNFAILLQGRSIEGPADSLYWWALHKAAVELSRRRRVTIKPYFIRLPLRSVEDWDPALLAELKAMRLAGLIAGAKLPPEIKMELQSQPWTKLVTIGEHPSGPLVSVSPSMSSFTERALTFLKARGRQRVAFVTNYEKSPRFADHIEMATAMGMHSEYHWVQSVRPFDAASICQVVHLLLAGEKNQRPDALVVYDDHMSQAVAQGIVNSGCDEASLDVVAYCNFPAVVRVARPITRLGFVARDFLETAVKLIVDQQEGRDVASHTIFEPRFDDELGFRVAPMSDAQMSRVFEHLTIVGAHPS